MLAMAARMMSLKPMVPTHRALIGSHIASWLDAQLRWGIEWGTSEG